MSFYLNDFFVEIVIEKEVQLQVQYDGIIHLHVTNSNIES